MSDVTRAELMRLANDVLREDPTAKIFFKFTCRRCGERCLLRDANTLWEEGECCRCGTVQPIDQGGLLVEFRNVTDEEGTLK